MICEQVFLGEETGSGMKTAVLFSVAAVLQISAQDFSLSIQKVQQNSPYLAKRKVGWWHGGLQVLWSSI